MFLSQIWPSASRTWDPAGSMVTTVLAKAATARGDSTASPPAASKLCKLAADTSKPTTWWAAKHSWKQQKRIEKGEKLRSCQAVLFYPVLSVCSVGFSFGLVTSFQKVSGHGTTSPQLVFQLQHRNLRTWPMLPRPMKPQKFRRPWLTFLERFLWRSVWNRTSPISRWLFCSKMRFPLCQMTRFQISMGFISKSLHQNFLSSRPRGATSELKHLIAGRLTQVPRVCMF